jgi:hypothetical protein
MKQHAFRAHGINLMMCAHGVPVGAQSYMEFAQDCSELKELLEHLQEAQGRFPMYNLIN